MSDRYLITGCSSGGKSTLLSELSRRCHTTIEEAGRRVVAQQQAAGAIALPWTDMSAFLQEVEILARADLEKTENCSGPVFFDRGLIDTLCAYELHLGDFSAARRVPFKDLSCYARTVFVAPPWRDIYVSDDVRRHGFAEAEREFAYTLKALPRLGFVPVMLPLSPPKERADFVLNEVG